MQEQIYIANKTLLVSSSNIITDGYYTIDTSEGLFAVLTFGDDLSITDQIPINLINIEALKEWLKQPTKIKIKSIPLAEWVKQQSKVQSLEELTANNVCETLRLLTLFDDLFKSDLSEYKLDKTTTDLIEYRKKILPIIYRSM